VTLFTNFLFSQQGETEKGIKSSLPSVHNKTISMIFPGIIPLLTSSQVLPFTSDHNPLIVHSWENQGSFALSCISEQRRSFI